MRSLLLAATFCAASLAPATAQQTQLRERLSQGLPAPHAMLLRDGTVPDDLLVALDRDQLEVADQPARARILLDRLSAWRLSRDRTSPALTAPSAPLASLNRAAVDRPFQLERELSGWLGPEGSLRDRWRESHLLNAPKRNGASDFVGPSAPQGGDPPTTPTKANGPPPVLIQTAVNGESVSRWAYYWKGFGYLVALAPAAAKSQIKCSGSLIAPQWVLTAGHCADENAVGATPLVCIPALDAKGDGGCGPPGASLRTHRGRFVRDGAPQNSDVALIRLDEPLPHPHPDRYPTIGRPGTEFGAFTSAGYGKSAAAPASATGQPPFTVGHIPRSVKVDPKQVLAFVGGRSDAISGPAAANVIPTVCSFDSGGPILGGWIVTGKEDRIDIIAVVHSTSQPSCTFGRSTAEWVATTEVRKWICDKTGVNSSCGM